MLLIEATSLFALFFYESIGNSTSKSLVLKPSLKLADDTKEWFFKRDIFEEERRLMEDSWFVGKKMALIFGRVLEMVHFFCSDPMQKDTTPIWLLNMALN